MSRVTVICLVEGQSENLFVTRLLAPYLSGLHQVDLRAPIVTTSRDRRSGTVNKGGGRTLQYYMNDLKRHFEQWRHQPDVWFTTLLDVYGLPKGFPQDEPPPDLDPYVKVSRLEHALKQEAASQGIPCEHFIPHLMLHELETLLFVDLDQLILLFPNRQREIAAIKQDVRSFGEAVESINQTREGAPSKRIAQRIRHYGRYKARGTSGMVDVLEKIGLTKLRAACPHFDAWLRQLEQLGNKGDPT
jgi:hypothetical protein